MMPVLGIDLGTTYACVAAYHDGKVDILTNDQEKRLTPAYIAFNDVERLYGNAAIKQGFVNMDNTVYGAKQLLGRCFNEPSLKKKDLPLGYNLEDYNNKPMIKVCYRKIDFEFFPEEVNAMILAQMKKIATQHFNKEITMAVISVPASFSDAQRRAIRDAGMIAGLKVLSLVNDPTAAAISYGMENKITSTSLVLVFDLGGGTFDVSIAKIAEGGIFSVLATRGDTNFGGDNFDNRMVLHYMRDFNERFGLDMSKDRRAVHRLRAACEKAKRTLSGSAQASVRVDALFGGEDFDATITRETFEKINADLFDKAIATVKEVLQDIDIAFDTVDEILLVGGSTRIPKLREMLSELFNNKELNRMINPDEAVACGAAHLAGKIIGHQQFTMKDVTSYSYVVPSSNGEIGIAISRNMELPTQAWISVKDELSPESPLTFKIFESNNNVIEENDLIGVFSLQATDSSTTSSTEICFTIDSSGVLSICGYQDNKKIQSTFVDRKQRLQNQERDRLCTIALQFDEADEEWKKRSEAKNNLENYVYAVKKSAGLRKYTELISEEQKTNITGKCDQILEWIENNKDPEKKDSEIKREQLENSWMDILSVIDPEKECELKLRKKEKQRKQLEALNALRDSVTIYRNTIEEPGYVTICTADEKSTIQWIFDHIINWLTGNTNADVPTIEKKKNEVEKIGQPIFQRLMREHEIEQTRKREEERLVRDRKRSDLKSIITAAQNKLREFKTEIKQEERRELESKILDYSGLLNSISSSDILKKASQDLATICKKIVGRIQDDRKKLANESKAKYEKRLERRGAVKDRIKNLHEMIKVNSTAVTDEEYEKLDKIQSWILKNPDAEIESIEGIYREVDGLWRTIEKKILGAEEHDVSQLSNEFTNLSVTPSYSSAVKKKPQKKAANNYVAGSSETVLSRSVDSGAVIAKNTLRRCISQILRNLDNRDPQLSKNETIKLRNACEDAHQWMNRNPNLQPQAYATENSKLIKEWDKMVEKLKKKNSSESTSLFSSFVNLFKRENSKSPKQNMRNEEESIYGTDISYFCYQNEMEDYDRTMQRSTNNKAIWKERDKLIQYRNKIFHNVMNNVTYRDKLILEEKAALQKKDREIANLISLPAKLEADDYKKKREELQEVAEPIIRRLKIQL